MSRRSGLEKRSLFRVFFSRMQACRPAHLQTFERADDGCSETLEKDYTKKLFLSLQLFYVLLPLTPFLPLEFIKKYA